jgi:hypothetical protein
MRNSENKEKKYETGKQKKMEDHEEYLNKCLQLFRHGLKSFPRITIEYVVALCISTYEHDRYSFCGSESIELAEEQ